VRYNANEQEIFLGHAVTQQQNVSERTAQIIDEEVRRLIEEAEDTARAILTEHRDELDKLANALLEFETLSGDDVAALLRGETLTRDDPKPPRLATPEPSTAGSVPSVPPEAPKAPPTGSVVV
jgi:cell division protease FtsH